ncbi:glycosyltransferase family 2 protein [Lachnospiraceae bacterium LCP25S3_G4]
MKRLKLMIGRSKEYYYKFGFKEFLKRIVVKIFHLDKVDYQSWILEKLPTKQELKKQSEKEFNYQPIFSIVVPLYETPLHYLEQMIESVMVQSYSKWELCLSDGSGFDSPIKDVLKRYTNLDNRIKVIYNEEKLNISRNTNKALEIVTGDYVAFMDHDDLLTPDALFQCVNILNNVGKQDLIYTDEDKITMDGKHFFQPHFKSDFNIDLLCSMNYFCHLVVVSRELYNCVGNLNEEFDGAQDYDFVLRCVESAKKIYHIPKVLYHWRAHKESTAQNPDSKNYAVEAGRNAIQAHYDRIGIKANVIEGEGFGVYKTKYQVTNMPKVSIIIPNKDHTDDLNKCIESIEAKTKYPNYEYIIIENNSELEETFEYYRKLKKNNDKVKIVTWKKKFNYAAINNYGVTFANGEYYWFLNNDTEIINSDCMEELLGYCTRADIGIVGARLYYPDNIVQHAGIVIGYAGIAGHAFIGQMRGMPGYFSRIVCAQDYSAVTAACMMVKKSVFELVDGFEEKYAVAFNDVDFCLRVREQGMLVVYNPYAELYHYESKSRGLEDTQEKRQRFQKEVKLFQKRWENLLKKGDPYYNINLTLEKPDFSLKPLDEKCE